MKVFFTVLGPPQGKGRPRFAKVGKYVKTYTPDQTVLYENLVAVEYQRQTGGYRFPDKEALDMQVFAYYAIPASASQRKQSEMENGDIRPLKKVDIDNLLKVICDALNQVAYRDDVQIVDCQVRKFYSHRPRVEVAIQPVRPSGGEL